MLERREARRINLSSPVVLRVGELEVRTRMINYSDDGALFLIEPPDHGKVSTESLGREAVFVLKVKNKPDREYRGEIIRSFFRDQDKYIALRFWEPYREL